MPAPPHLILDPDQYTDHDLGPLKTGKEAEVFVIERTAADGRRCLLAHKRYRPRRVTHKGELEALGFQRASTVHADLSVYNVLWFEDRPWVIDLPQAVDVSAHGQALELLRRDLGNVAPWFERRGAAFDADAVFLDLLPMAYR